MFPAFRYFKRKYLEVKVSVCAFAMLDLVATPHLFSNIVTLLCCLSSFHSIVISLLQDEMNHLCHVKVSSISFVKCRVSN